MKRYGIHLFDRVYLVVPERYSKNVVAVGHEDVNGVSLDSEIAALKLNVVSYVKRIHESS